MFAALLLGHRLAFVLLCALLLGAAAPLAFAWTRIFPEEQPPFRLDRPSRSRFPKVVPVRTMQHPRTDPVALALLMGVSLSYLLQLPGLPREAVLARLAAYVPEILLHWMGRIGWGLLLAVPAVAAFYSVLRPNRIRVPLLAAGILVPLLWLLIPLLQAALIAS